MNPHFRFADITLTPEDAERIESGEVAEEFSQAVTGVLADPCIIGDIRVTRIDVRGVPAFTVRLMGEVIGLKNEVVLHDAPTSDEPEERRIRYGRAPTQDGVHLVRFVNASETFQTQVTQIVGVIQHQETGKPAFAAWDENEFEEFA